MRSKSLPFHPLAQEALEKIQTGEIHTFVFDLDSTLFCVSPRTQVILRDFGDLEAATYPHHAKILKSIQVTPKDWGIKTALIRHGMSAPLDVFEAIRKHWLRHFFSSDYLHHDQPYPGAVEFVQKTSELGAEIFYLTGRDRPRMGEGTVRILRDLGFPLTSPENLLMKPSENVIDVDFKVAAFQKITKRHQGMIFFENEPVILNRIHRTFPDIQLIAMDSVHSGREEIDDATPRLPMSFFAPPPATNSK